MPTSEARIHANRMNATHSTGPKTEAGKERSRGNALKHGMTGAGLVLPEADAIEVERRATAFIEELNVTGEAGEVLARRAALNSVRMERGADQETATLSVRVRLAESSFVPPEGVSVEEADRLRAEAARVAMFDPSREASLARQYEAAAERGFFRALKELRQMAQKAKPAPAPVDDAGLDSLMGSFLTMQKNAIARDAEFEAILAEMDLSPPQRPAKSTQAAPMGGMTDLSFSVGRPR